MPDIVFGTGAYRRDNGNLPELRSRNMFLETSASSENGVVLLSRKGLSSYANRGDGPVTGLFSQENVFGGDVFCVSGQHLFHDGINVGAITGTGPVSFAAGATDELAVCAGSFIHRYNGTTLTTVSFPDDQDVSSIFFHDGLYIAAVKDDQKWYWSSVLDADTWNSLDFISAESRPDVLRDIKVIGDFLYLIGSETIEKWSNTGDADTPYSRIEGAIVQKGAIATGCTVDIDNTLVFVGDDGIVYRLGDVPQRISDHGIEERIAASDTVFAFGFSNEGHLFYCLRLDAGSFLYDVSTGQWCEFASNNRTNWRAGCACTHGLVTVFGDDTEGKLWSFGGWNDGDDPLERLFTAAFPLKGGTEIVDSLTIEANTGWTEFLAGQGSNPSAEMRSSRDGGSTWSNWRSVRLGQQGEYRVRTRWNRCGMFDFPGGIFEIRVTDPTPFRVSGVTINEPGGGRSR